jgi:hypothetical protein
MLTYIHTHTHTHIYIYIQRQATRILTGQEGMRRTDTIIVVVTVCSVVHQCKWNREGDIRNRKEAWMFCPLNWFYFVKQMHSFIRLILNSISQIIMIQTYIHTCICTYNTTCLSLIGLNTSPDYCPFDENKIFSNTVWKKLEIPVAIFYLQWSLLR